MKLIVNQLMDMCPNLKRKKKLKRKHELKVYYLTFYVTTPHQRKE